MAKVQQELWQKSCTDPQDLFNRLMFMKMEAISKDLENLEMRTDRVEAGHDLLNSRWKDLSACVETKHKTITRKVDQADATELLRECSEISKRAIEILSKWSDFQDIKMQIQFAAVIVGKIDRLKRNASVQSDDIKRKICTLLRNVIRLNVAEDLFSQGQIELLKKGFMLLDADGLKREDLLELNRELRKENLMTMPAWE